MQSNAFGNLVLFPKPRPTHDVLMSWGPWDALIDLQRQAESFLSKGHRRLWARHLKISSNKSYSEVAGLYQALPIHINQHSKRWTNDKSLLCFAWPHLRPPCWWVFSHIASWWLFCAIKFYESILTFLLFLNISAILSFRLIIRVRLWAKSLDWESFEAGLGDCDFGSLLLVPKG